MKLFYDYCVPSFISFFLFREQECAIFNDMFPTAELNENAYGDPQKIKE